MTEHAHETEGKTLQYLHHNFSSKDASLKNTRRGAIHRNSASIVTEHAHEHLQVHVASGDYIHVYHSTVRTCS